LNGRRRWPLHVRCCRKKFTFAISSPDEFLLILLGPSYVNLIWNGEVRHFQLFGVHISIDEY